MKTATMYRDWILEQNLKGLKLDLLNDEGVSPFLYGEIEGSEPNAETVIFYAHMDKQPPFEGWAEGLAPYKPVIKDDKLYARGASDDAYGPIASILPIKACQMLGLKHPRVVLLFEADEESGSAHMHHYIAKLKDRIGDVSIVFCLDSMVGNYDTFWQTYSLRGVVMGLLTVKVLNEGVHSGEASGIVPSSFRIIRMLLDRLENSKTGEMVEDF